MERELGYPEWELSSSRTETLIAASTAPGTRPVAWISWRDVPNFCNFLHWLSCIGDAPCDIIDVSELIVTYKPRDRPPTPPELVVSPSLISLHMFHEYGLLDQAAPLERGQREGYVSLWKRLQAEDMPLRIRSQDGLCSAQINQYDSIILSFVTPDWRRMPRLVHDAMTHANENSIIQCRDIMIGGRVLALIRAGVIEARGDLSHMRTTEIRLPSSRP